MNMKVQSLTDGRPERYDWIDIAKGIAIICTIIGHTVAFGGIIRNLIFSFHMPLFFVIAGYTIKPTQLDGILNALKKDFFRLIIPVLIMRGIDLVISLFIKGEPFVNSVWDNIRRLLWGNGNDYGPLPFSTPIQLYGVGVLWFLIALFWARSIYRLFDYKVKRYRFIILMFCSLFGMWVGSFLRLPQCLDMIPLIILFMECGKYLKENVEMNSRVWNGIGVFSFFLWIYLVCVKGIYIEMATRQYPYSMLCVLVAILGCISVIQLSQGLEQIKCSKAISFLGRNSLDMLCIHFIDEYLSLIWRVDLFAEGSSLYFANGILTPLARVILDVVLLLVWLLIKRYLKKLVSYS